MSNINFPEEILETNSLQTNTDIKNVKEELKKRLIRIFQIDDNDRLKSFEEFAENKDHWLEHSLHVYKKALEITTIMEAKWYKIDKSKLFVMSFMHDSGRFHFSEEKPKKRESVQTDSIILFVLISALIITLILLGILLKKRKK